MEILGLVCTEMISSRGLFYNDEKTMQLMNVSGEKRPISIQLFGNDPEIMGAAARKISGIADIIDINMGCPAPKIVKNGDGSKLLLDLERVKKIVEEVVRNVDKPVTVKIRKGWDKDNIVAVEAAKLIEKAGASAITVHGRTRDQYYSGMVDLDIIRQVKESVTIPVIGNGDIKTGKDAIKMFKETNVDGIMIGRAVLGNPWILKEITGYLEGKEEAVMPDSKERLEVIKKHLEMCIEECVEHNLSVRIKDATAKKTPYNLSVTHDVRTAKKKGEYVAIREMRKHICWYIKSLPDSSKVRECINKIEEKEELLDKLEAYFKNL